MTDASDANGTAYHDDVAGELERMRGDVRAALDLGDHYSAHDVHIGGLSRDRAASRRREVARAKEARAAAEDRGLVIAALARIERTGLATHDLAAVGLEVGQLALARVGAVKHYADREFDAIERLRAAEQRRRETTSAEDLEAQAQLQRRALGGITVNVDARASQHGEEPVEVVRAKGSEERRTKMFAAALAVMTALALGASGLAIKACTGHVAHLEEPTGSAHEGTEKK